MKNASALLSDGTLKGEYVPYRYGVQVMHHTENGERSPLSDVLISDKRYGLYGELSAVDVAENLQDLYVNITDDAFPLATVYASQAMFRELCDMVGTADSEPDCSDDCDGCLYCVPSV